MKDSSSKRNWRVFITLNIFLMLICSHGAINAQICGDADGSGSVNVGDGIFLARYLVLDGLVPPNLSDADFDGYEGISIYEFRFNGSYIGQGGLAPICPPVKPTLVAQPNSELLLTYSSLYPPNQDSFMMSIKIVSPFTHHDGFIFPLKIRVDGQIPNVLSIEQYCTGGLVYCLSRIVADSGIVILSNFAHWSGYLDFGENEIAKISIAVPPSTVPRSIEISWTVMSPINAPTPDSSLYPLFLNRLDWEDGGVYLPTLTPRCCSLAGDADISGSINISDAMFIIAYIFSGGDAPNCLDEGDANGSNSINISDATYLIAYIFSGGSDPICGTTAS